MPRPLRVLMVEDSEYDATLITDRLERGGFHVLSARVDTEGGMREKLNAGDWDIVLSDYTMPCFHGLAALEVLKQSGKNIPFIIVSGTIGEDIAVEAIQKGAQDYILKHNLAKLPAAIDRSMKEMQDRIARKRAEDAVRESEERFRMMADATPVMIWLSDTDGQCNYFNKTWLNFTGRPMEAEINMGWAENVHPEDLSECIDTYLLNLSQQQPFRMEYRLRRWDGQYRWILDEGTPRFTADREFAGYIGSAVDITEQKETEIHLKYAKELAETTSRKKSEFLAVMSHELRTPLNAIMGYSEMLSMGYGGSLTPKQKHYLHNVIVSSHHLLELVNDILDVAQIESGHIRLIHERIVLDMFFEDLLKLVEEQARQSRVTIDLRIEPGLDVIEADPNRLRQIFMNLLTNAIKFNRPGGRVEIRMYYSDDRQWIICKVMDTGIGIPEEQMPNLFTEFHQVDSSFTRKQEGIGLGLALVKNLVKVHGGSIRAESTVDKGTTFTFQLPAQIPLHQQTSQPALAAVSTD